MPESERMNLLYKLMVMKLDNDVSTQISSAEKYWTVHNSQLAVYQVDSTKGSVAISVVKNRSTAQFLTETNTRET